MVGLVSRRGQVVKCFVYHANGGVIFFWRAVEPLKGAWRPVRGLWKQSSERLWRLEFHSNGCGIERNGQIKR